MDRATLGKEHLRLSQLLFPYLLRCRNLYVTIHTHSLLRKNKSAANTIYPVEPLFQASQDVDLNLNEDPDSKCLQSTNINVPSFYHFSPALLSILMTIIRVLGLGELFTFRSPGSVSKHTHPQNRTVPL